MKRIEAVIASEKVLAVNEALKRVGVGGCTVLDAKGRGKGEKPMVEMSRGTGRFKAEFSVRADLVIVVQDSEVDNIINTIVGDGIYRQVDNIFLFNFTNDTDLDKISRMSLADNETIRSIVKTLPQRHCLSIGKIVYDLPVVVKIAPAEVLTLGETKKFFTRNNI